MNMQLRPKKISRPKKTFHLLPFLLPLPGILVIAILSRYPRIIEIYYAQQFYPAFSQYLRAVTSILPFSLGDLLYLIAGIYIVLLMIRLIKNIRNKQLDKKQKLQPILSLWLLLTCSYLIFYCFWGLNYYRLGVTHQLQIKNQPYTQKELKDLCGDLVQKINQLRTNADFDKILNTDKKIMVQDATIAYQHLSKEFPFLEPVAFSLKSSWYNTLGNYGGFLGYYNPFTGEGQINTQCPTFLQPFITCHELAHQLGYASESEANFIGYLATTRSENIGMQYSGQLEMYLYATGKLRQKDSIAAKKMYQQLHPFVKKDLKDYRNYLRKHETVFLEWTNDFYDFFLKSNNQQTGIYSYRDVVGWVIAYRKSKKLKVKSEKLYVNQ
jgi:hypothetical protein